MKTKVPMKNISQTQNISDSDGKCINKQPHNPAYRNQATSTVKISF